MIEVKSVPGFGLMAPDPIGEALGTGFMRFDTGRVSGLAKVKGQRADLLAVETQRRGKHHFREFIKNLQVLYSEIHALEISSTIVSESLARYGFKPIHDGVYHSDMIWTKGENL